MLIFTLHHGNAKPRITNLTFCMRGSAKKQANPIKEMEETMLLEARSSGIYSFAKI